MNILHAHLWGEPWTNDLGIFKLDSELLEKLLHLIEEQVSTRFVKIVLPELWDFIDNYIKEHGPCFFRLSGASPKDSTYKCQGPLLKADDIEHVLQVCFESNRFANELDEAILIDRDIAFILRKWNDEIHKCDEYRIFVGDGNYELAVRMPDTELAKDNVAYHLRKFVEKHASTFPAPTLVVDVAIDPVTYDITFIEFNPIDDELDMYNVDLSLLSETIRIAQVQPSATFKLLQDSGLLDI
jgi:hypothetical protein